MKKYLFLSAFCMGVSLFTGKAFSQQLFFVFGHGVYSSPVQSNLKNSYDFGLGGEAGVGIGMKQTFFVGTIGFTRFKASSSESGGYLNYTPIKVGLRHYLVGKILYMNLDGGMAVLKPENGSSNSRFTADAGVGVKLAGLDLALAYDGFAASNPSGWASWIGVKAGFSIGF